MEPPAVTDSFTVTDSFPVPDSDWINNAIAGTWAEETFSDTDSGGSRCSPQTPHREGRAIAVAVAVTVAATVTAAAAVAATVTVTAARSS